MSSRRFLRSPSAFLLGIMLLAATQGFGQYRGRKYKAPPPTSRIEVQVLKKFTGKPIPNAAVVFNPTRDGKDLGSLEVKTDPEGKAVIDIIPIGSTVRVQVIASGLSTFGQDYLIEGPTKEITIEMLRPQEQVSAYVDNSGKTAVRKPGVQEPIRPKPPVQPTTNPVPQP